MARPEGEPFNADGAEKAKQKTVDKLITHVDRLVLVTEEQSKLPVDIYAVFRVGKPQDNRELYISRDDHCVSIDVFHSVDVFDPLTTRMEKELIHEVSQGFSKTESTPWTPYRYRDNGIMKTPSESVITGIIDTLALVDSDDIFLDTNILDRTRKDMLYDRSARKKFATLFAIAEGEYDDTDSLQLNLQLKDADIEVRRYFYEEINGGEKDDPYHYLLTLIQPSDDAGGDIKTEYSFYPGCNVHVSRSSSATELVVKGADLDEGEHEQVSGYLEEAIRKIREENDK